MTIEKIKNYGKILFKRVDPLNRELAEILSFHLNIEKFRIHF